MKPFSAQLYPLLRKRRWWVAMFGLPTVKKIGLGMALASATIFASSCERSHRTRVDLRAFAPPSRDVNRLEIRAQVSGPLEGLTYKWLSNTGECVPQVGKSPVTTYKFASDAPRDRVAVEVWLDDRRVAFDEIEVTRSAGPPQSDRIAGQVQIEITEVPPYDPRGGPSTRSDIAGRVSGSPGPDAKIVVYARAHDLWYVQPEIGSTHLINPDSTWATWTHTGSSYAALVVRQGYTPHFTLDVLPRAGGDILARAIVEGRVYQPDQSTRPPPPPPVPTPSLTFAGAEILRVRAGARTRLVDANGAVWLAPHGFEDGVPLDRGSADPVANTDTPALYQSERYNVSRFACALPDGSYVVKLHFAEMFPAIRKPGERVFSFNVEGREFQDFDIVAKAGGPRTAYVETVPVDVSDGELTIAFARKVQYTVINGIEIMPKK